MEPVQQLSLLGDGSDLHASHNYFARLMQALDVADTNPAWPDMFGQSLNAWLRRHEIQRINALSLFSGGGGLDVAFHDAGFFAHQMIELDQRYAHTLDLNAQSNHVFEGATPLNMDIRDYRPSGDFPVDFIIGGPPCETFSAAGRRAAGVPGFDDPRGMLFQEYVRILDTLRPRGFLFENVYGIVGAQGGKPWKEIVNAFTSVGYTVSSRILDAADYGVPQHRERLVIVGVRDGEFLFPRPTHGPDSLDQRPFYTAELAVTGVFDAKPGAVRGRYGHLLTEIPPGLNYSFFTEEMGHPAPIFSWRSKFSDILYKADPNEPTRTIKAQGGQYTGPFHWANRNFSVGEFKRLQTIPDEYEIWGNRQVAIQQIGNSVPPQFARMLAISILDQVFGVPFPFEIDYLPPNEQLSFRKRKAAITSHYRSVAREAIARQYPVQTADDSVAGQQTFSVGSMRSQSDSALSLDNSRMAYIGADFGWYEQVSDSDSSHEWNVQVETTQASESLIIATCGLGDMSTKPQLVIEVSPRSRWNLPHACVKLDICTPTGQAYVACWKAFERYISQNGMKADLVQLNGYYHYQPKIRLEVTTTPDEYGEFRYWSALRSVLEGTCVRHILSMERLARNWDMPIREVARVLMWLRTLGYEVRSEFTNNQIPANHVLIPYAFPTLSPMSVQLRKALFPELQPAQRSGARVQDVVRP